MSGRDPVAADTSKQPRGALTTRSPNGDVAFQNHCAPPSHNGEYENAIKWKICGVIAYFRVTPVVSITKRANSI